MKKHPSASGGVDPRRNANGRGSGPHIPPGLIRRLAGFPLIACLIYAFFNQPSLAWAHGLGVQVSIHQDRLEVLASFDTNEPAEGVWVRVLDMDNHVVAEGETDAKGRCTLAAPPPGNYRVVADDGAGHRTVVEFGDKTTRIDTTPRDNLWLKILLGLAAIGVLALGAFMALRGKGHAQRGSANPG